MATHSTTETVAPLDLSKWRPLSTILMAVGGIGALLGFFFSREQFAFSWLTTFMFYLSLVLGGLFLVIAHHLFDANWSVPIRRITENLACLAPVMAVLFLPIAFLVKRLYHWTNIADPTKDHGLYAKHALLNLPAFYIVAVICFIVWTGLAFGLRAASLAQDKTGAASHTKRMRFLSCIGVVLFALTLTLGAIMWIKALEHHWFSTMFGVWYFAGSTWLTLATVYLITLCLKRTGPLREVVGQTQFYFLGSLLFAFTVFYAYVTFAQYFIIWNANVPEETFWYVQREKGTWFQISQIIIFGHFFVPFLLLLRIDIKLMPPMIAFLTAWAWLMHYCDMQFNIMPVLHPNGFFLHWIDIACMAFFGGLLFKIWSSSYFRYPPFPQRDPRIAETLSVYIEPPEIVTAPRTPRPA
jgi:hypothetical protein